MRHFHFGIFVLFWSSLSVACRAVEPVAAVLIRDAWAKYQLGEPAEAERILEDAALEARAANRPHELNESRAKLAWLKSARNQGAAAEALVRQVDAADLSTSDRGRLELMLARFARSIPEAVQHADQATQLLDASADRPLLADAYSQLAWANMQAGNYRAALSACRQARNLIDSKSRPADVARNLVLEARLAKADGNLDNFDRAILAAQDVIKDKAQLLSVDERADLHALVASIRLSQSDLTGAYDLLTKARAEIASAKGDNHVSLAPLVLRQAEILIEQGRMTEAQMFVDWVMFVARSAPHHVMRDATFVRGRLNLANGNVAAAQQDFHTVLGQLNANPQTASGDLLTAKINLLRALSLQGPSEFVVAECRQLQTGPSEIPQLAMTYAIFAQQKLLFGRADAAASLAGRAVEMLDAADLSRSPDMLECLLIHSESCIASGQISLAGKSIDRLVELQRDGSTLSDIWKARTFAMKGLLCIAHKDDATARNYLELALDIWSAPDPGDERTYPRTEFRHPEKGRAHIYLAALDIARGDMPAGEENWQGAQAVMSAQLSPLTIARWLMNSAGVCSNNGRIVEALWLYEKASKTVRETSNPSQLLLADLQRKMDVLAFKQTR